MMSRQTILGLVLSAMAAGCVAVHQPVGEEEGTGGDAATDTNRTGGVMETAGALGSGGAMETAGVVGAGGAMETAGVVGAGGATEVAGAFGSGGAIVTAGVVGAGGAMLVGGNAQTGGVGGMGCDCPSSLNECIRDYCDAQGACVHEPVVGDVDSDGDGAPAICDCDDNNPDIYPGQTTFFAVPHELIPDQGPIAGSSGELQVSFDYNCDGWGAPRYTDLAQPCEAFPGSEACFGDGWVLEASQSVPECGAEANYQTCNYMNGACQASNIMLTQSCR